MLAIKQPLNTEVCLRHGKEHVLVGPTGQLKNVCDKV